MADKALELDPDIGKPATLEDTQPASMEAKARALLADDEEKPKEKAPSPLSTTRENFRAAVGKGATDVGRAAVQMMNIPAQWLESKFPGISEWSQRHGFPSASETAQKNEQAIAESRKLDEPLMNTTEGMAGDIVGNIGVTGLGAGTISRSLINPMTYGAAATVGAGQGALTPTQGDESRIKNTLVGAGAGMAGNLAANTVGRIAQPVSNVLTSAHQKAVKVLTDAGIPLDAAQKTGSAFLAKLRSSFFDNPFTAGAQLEQKGAQQAAFNRAVLRTAGENATEATPDVMRAADDRIDGEFKRILGKTKVNIGNSTLDQIGNIQAQAAREQRDGVVNQANHILSLVDSNGHIDGQSAYNVKKDLDRMAKDQNLGYHAHQLRTALMDAINGSLSDDDKVAFQKARSQFGNLRRIEETLDKEGRGDIPPGRLANVMSQKRNRNISIYGRGPQELVDLAHSGNMLLPDKTPQSGTATRWMMQAIPPLIGAGAGAYESGGDVTSAIGAGIGGYAAPKIAQKLINNPRTSEYIAKGMANGTMRDWLTSPQTDPLLGSMLRRLPASTISARNNKKPNSDAETNK